MLRVIEHEALQGRFQHMGEVTRFHHLFEIYDESIQARE